LSVVRFEWIDSEEEVESWLLMNATAGFST